MIESASLIAGAVLLLLLMGVATQGWLASRKLQDLAPASSGEDVLQACSEELVSRIFSRADWEFVRGLKAGSIERLFERERKKVALVWVRQTSAMIRKVMREHAQAARQSKNLKSWTEINILAQFLALMTICGILSVAIRIVGPLWLGSLAHFVHTLSQRLTKVQTSFQTDVMEKARGAASA
jgi:hypothetical protein